MSYNVAIATPPVPNEDSVAWAKLNEVIDEKGPRPSVFQELHDRLTARYPCMCSVPEELIDDTVWSDGPLINNFGHRAAVLGMSFSRVEEVLPFQVDTANSLGLTVFDWATGRIYRGQQLAAGIVRLTAYGGPPYKSRMLAFHNGRFLPYSDLHIRPHDAGFVFGATVTDFCRTYAHNLFRWPDHLARLRRDCEACYIPLPYSDAELTAAAETLVRENAKGLAANDDLALITFATPGSLGYMVGEENGPPSVAMHTFPIPKERYRRFFTEGVTLSWAGFAPQFLDPLGVKHRSRIHWWTAAQGNRLPRAVPVLWGEGNTPDTAIGAVLLVRSGVIERPSSMNVDSISVKVVAELAGGLGIEVSDRGDWMVHPAAEGTSEVLLAGSGFGIAGVRTYMQPKNRHDFPWPGPVFTRLAAAWSELVGLDIVKQFTG